jgi:hypothetical protein
MERIGEDPDLDAKEKIAQWKKAVRSVDVQRPVIEALRAMDVVGIRVGAEMRIEVKASKCLLQAPKETP